MMNDNRDVDAGEGDKVLLATGPIAPAAGNQPDSSNEVTPTDHLTDGTLSLPKSNSLVNTDEMDDELLERMSAITGS